MTDPTNSIKTYKTHMVTEQDEILNFRGMNIREQYINILFSSAFIIISLRSVINFYYYELNISNLYFKITTSIVLVCFVLCLLIKRRIKISSNDYLYISVGIIFISYNIVIFDLRGAIISFYFFICIYIFYPFIGKIKLFHRVFLITSSVISFEMIFELILYNGEYLGLAWKYGYEDYYNYANRFNPLNDSTGVIESGIFRLDGIFGNHQLTGSYLAVSTSYLFGLSIHDIKKYILLFFLNFIALVATTSTVSFLAFFLSVLIIFIIKKKYFYTVLAILIIWILSFIPMISVFSFRFFTNMDNELYVKSFFWRDELYRYIIGFNFTVNHESDLIEMLHKFGILPFILICFKLFYYPIIKCRFYIFKIPFVTASAFSIVAGGLTLIHQSGISGWHIGLHFLFLVSYLSNYLKQSGYDSLEKP